MKSAIGALALLSLLACDSSGDNPGSHFTGEEAVAREISGIVYRGEDPVPGAFVQIDPAANAGDSAPKSSSIVTDAVGRYTGLRNVPFRYDFTAALGDDVLVYRGVGARLLLPDLEGPLTPPKICWRTKLDVQLAAPPAPGHKLAFFANGDKVFGTIGSLAEGVTLVTTDYTDRATVFAVEYSGDDLSTATAYGKVDNVVSNPSATVLAAIKLAPISEKVTVRVLTDGDLTQATADLFVTYSRTSIAKITSVRAGAPLTIPVIPDAGTTARVRRTVDGTESASGEVGYDFNGPPLAVVLPAVPVVVEPADGAKVTLDTHLVATGTGVLEHILTPEKGGATVRIITANADAALPSFATIGAAAPTGRWSWTVRTYPNIQFAEQLSDLDKRRYQASAATKPRILDFQ